MEQTLWGSMMTEKLFFDTDCFSSFLMVGREDIILMNSKGEL
jgi:hypothetical protein